MAKIKNTAQQPTTTSRPQIFDLFYAKNSAGFNELSFKCQTTQEVAKKWLKLKNSRKHIYAAFGA